MDKNKTTKELYNDFGDYISEHPEERFFQALRNWMGVGYVLVSELPPTPATTVDQAPEETKAFLGTVDDTFYWNVPVEDLKEE